MDSQTYLAKLYIPKAEFSASQMMTIGENAFEIRLMPNGWARNSKTKIVQVTPMMVDFEIFLLISLRPCTAPRTDCAGVRTPSAMAIDTAKTPMACRR